MKKTGLPLDYPNIPQLSSVAATHLAAALLHTCPPEALPPEGDGRGRTPRRSARRTQTKRPAHIVRAYSIRSDLRLPSVGKVILPQPPILCQGPPPVPSLRRCCIPALPRCFPRRGTGGGEPCAAAHGIPLLLRLPRRLLGARRAASRR